MFNIFDLFKLKRLSKAEIINETIEFYSADISRRSTQQGGLGGCKYNHENGNHCAVGRFMRPKYQNQGTKLKGNTNGIGVFLNVQKLKSLDKALLKPYRGHETRFWSKLQSLHDDGHFWEIGGLTEKGKEALEELKNQKY